MIDVKLFTLIQIRFVKPNCVLVYREFRGHCLHVVSDVFRTTSWMESRILIPSVTFLYVHIYKLQIDKALS